jgi:hypothetical protein
MRASAVIAIAIAISIAGPALAEEQDGSLDVVVMPGESHAISHAHSASRDTGLMGYQVLPRVVLTTGADFSFIGFRFSGLDLRAGMFGMFEVQTITEQPSAFLYVPAGPYIWRGLMGYSLALSLEELARRWLGPRGALEIAVSFRHESEHWTGGSAEDNEKWSRRFAGAPHIGDFIMPDLAIRAPAGPVDIEFRVQCKTFLPTYGNYTAGPGLDLIFRWRVVDWVHPFLSLFAEYLFGDTKTLAGERQEIPDNYLARGLLGVMFPGETADIQIFAAVAHGHDKGLLVLRKDTRFGWGIRIGFFKGPRADVDRDDQSADD